MKAKPRLNNANTTEITAHFGMKSAMKLADMTVTRHQIALKHFCKQLRHSFCTIGRSVRLYQANIASLVQLQTSYNTLKLFFYFAQQHKVLFTYSIK